MTRPISVLHARVVTGSGGGPDKTVLRSAAYLPYARFDVAAAYLHPKGDPGVARLWDTAHAQGMPLVSIPERGAIDRRALRQLIDLCRRRRVDIWHSHDYKTDVLGLLIRRKCPGIKLVSTVHGFTRENLKTRFYARLNGLALRHYNHIFAVSPALLRHCVMRGVHPDRLSYLPNAIELAKYPIRSRSEKQHARQAFGLSDRHAPAIAVLGRLSAEKGTDRSIRLFADVRKAHPRATLHLIGNGPERGRLESVAQSLGVADGVTFHGWSVDPVPLLRAMDLLLSTSHREGMPNTLLEAMAIGVPIAATAVGGVPEMLDHGACGALLQGSNITAWTTPVSDLLTPTPQRAANTLNARSRVESHYAFDARMLRIQKRYEILSDHATLKGKRAA
ncbi:glycosyltransferase [Phycisphaeraceae bacterium D3-23]